MKIDKKLNLEDLIFTALTMLMGREGKDFCYYETDPDWWTIRLYSRRN